MIKTTKMSLQYLLGVITMTEKEKMLAKIAYSK